MSVEQSKEHAPLVKVEHLKKYFRLKSKFGDGKIKVLKAVDDVSLEVREGETVGLVGESGCGKSTLGRSLLRLHDITDGSVIFDGVDITRMKPKELRPLRPKMQMVFQDPYASLDPRKTIFQAVQAPLDALHSHMSEEEKSAKVEEMLTFVGMGEYQFHKMPHELSGGQRQRVVIARSMVCHPKFIVCDEPVSALDVSVRSQVLNLMKDAQKEYGMAYLFISHDLSVVRYLCDRIVVMYLGKVVEEASKQELFDNAVHPYTKALLSAIPIPDVDVHTDRIILEGDVPSPIAPPPGCRFHTRCPHACDRCREEVPELRKINENHLVACHRAEEIMKGKGKA